VPVVVYAGFLQDVEGFGFLDLALDHDLALDLVDLLAPRPALDLDLGLILVGVGSLRGGVGVRLGLGLGGRRRRRRRSRLLLGLCGPGRGRHQPKGEQSDESRHDHATMR
jgi:hypothetical protein